MEKKETDNKVNKRRNFLRKILAAGAGAGLFSLFSSNTKAGDGEKIKLLTPDGKLIEIDKSKIRKEVTPGKATDAELISWMNENRKKS